MPFMPFSKKQKYFILWRNQNNILTRYIELMNVVTMLQNTASRYGSRTFILQGEKRMTYLELETASNKIANALIEMGIQKGDRIAIILPNTVEYAAIFFGIIKSGGIAVPLDARYKADELVSLFNNSQPRMMICGSPYLEALHPAMPRFTSIEKVIDLSGKFPGRYLSYGAIMSRYSALCPKVTLKDDDITHVAYTSGTTGQPKGVMVTHASMVAEAVTAAAGFQQTDQDVVMLYALPMHHAFALVVVTMVSILKGSTIVMSPGLSVTTAFELVEKEKGTIFMGVPSAYILAVEVAEKNGRNQYDLSTLRLCGSAGAALPTDIVDRFKHFYALDIINFWGMTETTAHVTLQPIDGSGKFGAVGKALDGWQIKIVDEKGQDLPNGQTGEVAAKGPIMRGYFNNPAATLETIKDGWLLSGDLGSVDEEGYLFLKGRKKEVIVVAGQKVYPVDVESVLYTHPKVAEAAVVGVEDGLRGETVRAVVRLKEGMTATEREIKTFCREYMADFKLPKEVIFIDVMPKITTGKIKKQDLKGDLGAFIKK
jgi:long-chain acyl-CoA synthetase